MINALLSAFLTTSLMALVCPHHVEMIPSCTCRTGTRSTSSHSSSVTFTSGLDGARSRWVPWSKFDSRWATQLPSGYRGSVGNGGNGVLSFSSSQGVSQSEPMWRPPIRKACTLRYLACGNEGGKVLVVVCGDRPGARARAPLSS